MVSFALTIPGNCSHKSSYTFDTQIIRNIKKLAVKSVKTGTSVKCLLISKMLHD